MKAKKKPGGKTPRQNRQPVAGLPAHWANVAGIDLGSEQHWVCAPALDGVGREVAEFGGATAELLRLAAWLKGRKVESVAMESTGVYWIAPQEVLEGQGLAVLLVDTRPLAQVPGRDKKSDPSDCEWLQRLHSCGLLKGAFRPKEEVCMLRTLVRDQANLVAEWGDWIRRLQKSLEQMNVRLHRAVADVDGATGMAILRAELQRAQLWVRPGRSAHDAVPAAQQYAQEGKDWVVDIDITKFFDQVNHDILMGRIAAVIRDKRVLHWIGKYLRRGAI